MFMLLSLALFEPFMRDLGDIEMVCRSTLLHHISHVPRFLFVTIPFYIFLLICSDVPFRAYLE